MAKDDPDPRLRRYEALLTGCDDQELVQSLDPLLVAVTERLQRRTPPGGAGAKRRRRATQAAQE